jgi:hypothetical protein
MRETSTINCSNAEGNHQRTPREAHLFKEKVKLKGYGKGLVRGQRASLVLLPHILAEKGHITKLSTESTNQTTTKLS